MADLMQSGIAWLAGQLRTNASQAVTYTHKASGKAVSVQAVLGKSLLALGEDFGQRLQRTDADFVIVYADLVAAFALVAVTYVQPERGDMIKATLAGVVQDFQVLAPGNEPPFRWDDPYHTMLRCHGKWVGNG
jgi:hypothetical protein